MRQLNLRQQALGGGDLPPPNRTLAATPASSSPAARYRRSPAYFCWSLLLVPALLSAPLGLAQGLFLDSRSQVKNARVAVYLDSGPEPAAWIRAGRIFSDYQSRGFFRIGALPLLVIDKLAIELRDPERISKVLASVGEKFGVNGEARKAVEGRDFRLSFTSSKEAQLRARRVRLESGAPWRLQDGVIQQPNSTPIPFHQATLAITGPNAGELAYETARGTARVHLLSLFSKSTPKDSAL